MSKSTQKVPPSKAEKQATLKAPAETAAAPAKEEGATVAATAPAETEKPKGKGKKKDAPVEDAAAAAPVEEKAPGKIEQILKLYTVDKLSRKAIEELGFHKTTIAIQTAKFRKNNPDFVETANPPKQVKEKPAPAAAAPTETAAANTAQ